MFIFIGDAWKHVSKNAKDLIKKMLTYDQNERITAADAYAHPWIQSKHKDEINPAIFENLTKFHVNELV